MADDRVTVRLSGEHVQRARNAAAWFIERGATWVTLHSILVGGESYLSMLEQAFYDGKPFPTHDGPLSAGRPRKKNSKIEVLNSPVLAVLRRG